MSLRVFLRDQPQRIIALVTTNNVLAFRDSPTTSQINSRTPRCMVEFCTKDQFDLSEYVPVRSSSVHGTLGLINVNADTFICVISGASPVATIRPGENVLRIISVEFCKLLLEV